MITNAQNMEDRLDYLERAITVLAKRYKNVEDKITYLFMKQHEGAWLLDTSAVMTDEMAWAKTLPVKGLTLIIAKPVMAELYSMARLDGNNDKEKQEKAWKTIQGIQAYQRRGNGSLYILDVEYYLGDRERYKNDPLKPVDAQLKKAIELFGNVCLVTEDQILKVTVQNMGYQACGVDGFLAFIRNTNKNKMQKGKTLKALRKS